MVSTLSVISRSKSWTSDGSVPSLWPKSTMLAWKVRAGEIGIFFSITISSARSSMAVAWKIRSKPALAADLGDDLVLVADDLVVAGHALVIDEAPRRAAHAGDQRIAAAGDARPLD